MIIRTGIIIISDKGSRGERIDRSGPALKEALQGQQNQQERQNQQGEQNHAYEVVGYQIVPDEKEAIQKAIIQFSDASGPGAEPKCDLILTSGGTGLSPRDVTPEATQELVDRLVPGFAEAMRMHSLQSNPHAMISRAICGTRRTSLILNLPGSPNGARECLEVALPAIPHAIAKLKGDPSDCGKPGGHQNPANCGHQRGCARDNHAL
jgi:molybdenum cofactor synthesis domain-containing protein